MFPSRRPAFECVINGSVPDHERRIRIRALVADEPGPIGEHAVKNSYHAFDLVPVAGLSGRELLGVAYVEPAQLHQASGR